MAKRRRIAVLMRGLTELLGDEVYCLKAEWVGLEGVLALMQAGIMQ